MHRILIGLLALSALLANSFAATKRRSTTSTSKSRVSSATSRTKAKGRRRTVAKTPRRTYQTAPTPERYKEIQQALADKGYFKGEANGQWGPDSVDALRRFQADQNLEVDGKLGSLSLIALGLGPKRTTAQVRPDQQTVAPDQANQPNQSKQEQQ